MRRQKPIAVKVKAPSRGLSTRWPSETADLAGTAAIIGPPADSKRVCVVAQNMRFEDGVMASAPGHERVGLVTALLTNCVYHWPLDEASGARVDLVVGSKLNPAVGGDAIPNVESVAGKIGRAAHFTGFGYLAHDGLQNQVRGQFTMSFWANLDSVANNLTLMSVSGFSIAFATATKNISATVTGDTVTSAVNSVTTAGTWYMITLVADGANLKLYVNTTSTSVAHTPPGGSIIPVLQIGQSAGLTLDLLTVWSRGVSAGEVTALYNGGSALSFPFLGGACDFVYEGNIINSTTPRPLVMATPSRLYSVARSFSTSPRGYIATLTQIFSGNTATEIWRATDFYDKVVFAEKVNVPQYWKIGASSTLPVPGLALNSTDPFSSSSDGYEKFSGVEGFAGHLLFWRDDLLFWSDLNDFGNYIPIGATVNSTRRTSNAAVAFAQPVVGSTVTVTLNADVGFADFVVGQYVRMIFDNAGTTEYNYYQVTAIVNGTPDTVTLKLLGTTGRSATATDFTVVGTANQTITSLDANEAGVAQLVGANANGSIFRIWAMGDYAYVFKEWSIQSLQYVGQSAGTFFSRTEVVKEGLIGRNSGINLGNGSIVFLGHRELYQYGGGPTPKPVCRQYTRQLFTELDRTRLDQIVLFHREHRNEVWIVYPVTSGQKVLIWNYVEDSATIDVYDSGLQGLAAATRCGWTVDPPWNSGGDARWIDIDPAATWSSGVNGGNEELMLVVFGNGTFSIHGQVYDRNGAAYTALAETMDYDFGDSTMFKYVDVVHIGLQVKATDNQVRTLYVQVGGRTALDGNITWTAPKAIQVQGNANFTTKINPGGAGRYLRLRFYSQDADVQWRVSSYEIFCRPGGTY